MPSLNNTFSFSFLFRCSSFYACVCGVPKTQTHLCKRVTTQTDTDVATLDIRYWRESALTWGVKSVELKEKLKQKEGFQAERSHTIVELGGGMLEAQVNTLNSQLQVDILSVQNSQLK